ncbi:glycosyltransferase family 2 protein [Paraclostridium bifermentans]|uniref:glycosyltransferase family 2 protein n=1 Tax=Paraclostridium bifermentans TaxID=1490 RepID=UPI00290AF5CF|nr:glycosyltransferase family 2 protein [Paraclostridium bifermentans]MDU3338238.1 glycosyltransferase family 2 protein [Paraclostridium bifermentans]
MNSVIATIITYNPNLKRLEKNILSIVNQVEEVLILDNKSSNIASIKKLISVINKENNKNIGIIENDSNRGIAYALNQSINYAYSNNYHWTLTLDQDSICDEDMIKYMELYLETNDKENIGIIAPSIIDENKQNEIEKMSGDIEFPTVVITSGSLTNTKIAKKIGGFVNELFIDYVDHEFCLRLRKNKYNIVKLKKAKLYHELGEIKTYNLFGKTATTTNHSDLRRYYYYRNSIYVHKTYKKEFPEWVKLDRGRQIRAFIGILMFEKNKLNKVSKSIKGLRDGFKGRYGEF